ncbi:MAG TPA: hypothetical protein PLZ51_22075, partial [Aggregatilineales bacterium]|nr:hypothetical protein [Aggregatilineales bacterium]
NASFPVNLIPENERFALGAVVTEAYILAGSLDPNTPIPASVFENVTSSDFVLAGMVTPDSLIPLVALNSDLMASSGDIFPRDARVMQGGLSSTATLDLVTGTAQGLNPLLRHFGMAIHPPMLYLG